MTRLVAKHRPTGASPGGGEPCIACRQVLIMEQLTLDEALGLESEIVLRLLRCDLDGQLRLLVVSGSNFRSLELLRAE